MKYQGCEGTWTDERVELLKKLWNEGLSAANIARTLGGVSRNAVIGKVHRAGLSNRPAAATLTRGVKKPKQERRAQIKSVFTPPTFAKVRTKLRCVDVVSDPVVFVDRTRDQCAFIIDGFAETTCCGAAVKISANGLRFSNCPAHETLSHTAEQPRRLHYDGNFGSNRRPLAGVARRHLLPNEMREAA